MTTPGKLTYIHIRSSYVFRPGSTSPGLFGRKVTNIHGDAARKVRRFVTSCTLCYAVWKIVFLRENHRERTVRLFVCSMYIPIPRCKEHPKPTIPKGYNGPCANNICGKLFAKYARNCKQLWVLQNN